MIVVGIDPSLNNTAYCIMEKGVEPEVGKIKVGKMRGMERLMFIEDSIFDLVTGYDDMKRLIVIEGYSYASVNQAHQAGELGGILRRMFYLLGYPWVEVAPGTLKKFVTGKGNADKNLMILNVYKRWGLELGSDDEADAYGLAKAGTYLLGADDSDLIKPQKEALETIRQKWGAVSA